MKTAFITVFIAIAAITMVAAAEIEPVEPDKKVKCPVCGMFVYKYPDWVGEIIFKDGSIAYFDGAKDLFKYYFNLKKYNPGKSKNDISAIFVTEYYDLKMIDAKKAFFVIGSDVYGPMGKELIPLMTKDGAEEFLRDHSGTHILKFEDINPTLLKKLD